MKKLLILLLLVPSLSWGKIIPLSCNTYYNQNEDGVDREFNYFKRLFFFDNKEMTITLGDSVYSLIETNPIQYKFKRNDTSVNISSTIRLNRYTHQIKQNYYIESGYKEGLSLVSNHDCKIVENKL